MAAFAVALRFLSRIPAPAAPAAGADPPDDLIRRSLRWYPAVGVLLGALLWAAAELLIRARVPVSGGAALLVALDLWLTGGLHLDGWMDTADGLGSRREREQILTVMRDSRVGAVGVMAAVAVLLLEWSFLQIWMTGGARAEVLLASWGMGRWIMVWAVAAHPYARSRGMGSALRGAGPGDAAAAAAALAIPAGIAVIGRHWSVVFGGAAAFFAARMWAGRIARKLGGLTGDVYGALCVLSQICLLVIAEVVDRWT
ncbi:MAG: adenosylcobinamide-GDP ribazoletransferase [Kyrpidia sp.]|nr:adenosylcobinamide-GDP ribazoletransferase [Kyrpidia sp.]